MTPGALYASMERIEVTAICLESTYKSQVCLRANWNENDNKWQVTSTSRLNLQQVSAYIPEKYSLNLPLEFHFTAEGTGNVIKQLQITGEAASGSFTYRGNQVIHTEIQGTQLTTTIDSRGAIIKFHTTFGGNNVIKVELFLPKATSLNLFDKNQPLEGKINIDLNNFDIIQSVFPDLMSPRNKFKASFIIGGSIGQPIVKGSASLEGSDVKIPGLNIQLSQINLAVNASGRELNYILNATSGGQPLRVTGKTSLLPPDFSTDLNLTGTEVLFADTPVYTIYVSPNINLHIKKNNIDLTGTVTIPKGMLHKLSFQHETTLPEDEVVFIGERPIAKESSWNTHMQLTVNLGSDVKVDSPGLKGNLSGSLMITSSPEHAILGNGRIDINNGIYEVYGRELTIAPASGIVFRSSLLSNPFLNIQAFTRILVTDAVSQQQLGTNEITVGMNIAGTSASPQVTLFSSAGNLSQADILSFLLLGTSSSGISPTNMNLLLQALNNLPLTKKGAGSVQGLTNQVKQGLGLSELGVESEATFGPGGEALPTAVPTSYFVVGKRLTSRIYFRYKYDPFNSTNLFQLNYLFSTNWSLQLETDGASQSGIDILYSIQTGAPTSADKTPATSH